MANESTWGHLALVGDTRMSVGEVPTFRREEHGDDVTISIDGEWPERARLWSPLSLWGDPRWVRWQWAKTGLVGSLVRFRLTNSAATYRVTETFENDFEVEAVRVWQRKAKP